MVSVPDIGRCANEDVGPQRGVGCEIPHWSEMGTKHSLLGCGNFSTRFKNLERKPKEDNIC